MESNQSEIKKVIDQLLETKMQDPHNKVKIQNLQQLLDRLTREKGYNNNLRKGL